MCKLLSIQERSQVGTVLALTKRQNVTRNHPFEQIQIQIPNLSRVVLSRVARYALWSVSTGVPNCEISAMSLPFSASLFLRDALVAHPIRFLTRQRKKPISTRRLKTPTVLPLGMVQRVKSGIAVQACHRWFRSAEKMRLPLPHKHVGAKTTTPSLTRCKPTTHPQP